jgi:hypothetical protein
MRSSLGANWRGDAGRRQNRPCLFLLLPESSGRGRQRFTYALAPPRDRDEAGAAGTGKARLSNRLSNSCRIVPRGALPPREAAVPWRRGDAAVNLGVEEHHSRVVDTPCCLQQTRSGRKGLSPGSITDVTEQVRAAMED